MINLINLLFCFWNEYLVHFRGFRKSLPITRVSAGQATGLLKIELYVQELVARVNSNLLYEMGHYFFDRRYKLSFILNTFFSSEIIAFSISNDLYINPIYASEQSHRVK